MELLKIKEDIVCFKAHPDSADVVPLHILCSNCKAFVRDCRTLNMFIRQIDSGGGIEYYDLCSLSELLDDTKSCHLCKLVSATWDKELRGRKDQKVNDRVRIHMYQISGEIYINLTNQGGPLVSTKLFIRSTRRDRFDCNIRAEDENDAKLARANLKSSTIPLRAQENLYFIQNCLQGCLEEHSECQNFIVRTVDNQRPTRILDVSNDRVRLECHLKSIKEFEYMGLSHMWGPEPSRQLQLESKNFIAFQQEIPSDKLSTIYKEAIRITRFLGYRYLWIDSLCIIQDNRHDWETEANRMAAVYGNAVCNISYLFPPQCATPRRRYDPRGWVDCRIYSSTPSPASEAFYVSRGVHSISSNTTMCTPAWIQREPWSLMSRAWAFQERLLCPRVIYCGGENLVFECSQLTCDELVGRIELNEGAGIIAKRWFADLLAEEVPWTLRVHDEEMREGPFQHFSVFWTRLVNDYRSRNLTISGDRVIALAGVARAVQDITGLTYLAGLWKELLALNLLWRVRQVQDRSATTNEFAEPGVLGAPSWSWFSAPIRMGCKISGMDGVVLAAVGLGDSYLAILISFRYKDQPENHVPDSFFYDFSGLQIRLRSLVSPASLFRTDKNTIRLDVPALTGSTLPRKSRCSFFYEHDNVEQLTSADKLPCNIVVSVIRAKRRYNDTWRHEATQNFLGLALIPCPADRGWRRIGMWTGICSTPLDEPEDCYTDFSLRMIGGMTEPAPADVETSDIFRNFADWKEEDLVLV